MTSLPLLGAAIGLLFGLGLLLVILGAPLGRRPALHERLEPYVSDSPRPSRLLGLRPHEELQLNHILSPVLRRAGRWLGGVLGGASELRRRLERAGLPADPDGFRAQQVLWAVVGASAGTALATALVVGRGASPVVAPGLVVAGAVMGVLGRDQLLSRAINRRESQMLMEFPALAELLALSVAAGEGAASALARVTRLSKGALAGEFRSALGEVRAGATLPEALEGVATRTGLSSIARFVDGIVIAVERGTPLADVMRAQAQDARESARQAIIEEGGKREIAMMVPVVFFVLPVTILFAVYPGVVSLDNVL